MTIGMVVDYLITCQNEDIEEKGRKNRDDRRAASQYDVDAW